MGAAGQEVCMGEMRNVQNILVRKTKGKRPLGRPRHRWEDIIRMDRGKIRWKCVNGIHVAQDRDQWEGVVNTVMNLQIPQNFLTS
jgi:hypothetical protein